MEKLAAPLTVPKPYWYGRDRLGRFVITLGPDAQRAFDARSFESTVRAFIKRLPKIRDKTLEACLFCGGAFEHETFNCEDCGRPAGTPITKDTTFEILSALFASAVITIDLVDRDEDAYTISFTTGTEASDDTAASLETQEQWSAWKRVATGQS